MNKFFKPTIQNKMLLAILPILFVQVVIVGGITLLFATQEFHISVDQYIQQRKDDLSILSENPDILNYLQNVHYGLEDEALIYKKSLEELFGRLIQRTETKKGIIYKEIFFVNAKGKEIAKKIADTNDYNYNDISKLPFFIKSKEIPSNKVDQQMLSNDLILFYTPIYIDVDGSGKYKYSGLLAAKTVYPVNDFIKSTIFSASMTLILLVIGMLIIYSTVSVVKKLVKPINNLVDATRSLSAGNLSVKADIISEDELGELAKSFNQMAEDLKKNINELEEYKNELEIKVTQRTQELKDSNQQLSTAYDKLKAAQTQLIHSEKMASLGQLVAGVAHELNNPINFIYGNMPHLRNYIDNIKNLFEEYDKTIINVEDKLKLDDLKQEINWEFLLSDLDLIIVDCKNGAERAKKIVNDLRNFSRLGEAEFKFTNIHEGIDSTLNLLAHEYKNKIKIEKDYGVFDQIECYPDQLNQVFMNLLSNAAHAMPKEKILSGDACVWITTYKENNNIKIVVKDNASGISQEELKKIFDPFYTTKPIGKGTGLGLSITYGIIEKHNGSIEVKSIEGVGTTFSITLPIYQRD